MNVGGWDGGHMWVLRNMRAFLQARDHETESITTYMADDLALHEEPHGHMEAEELARHLQLQVVLCLLPLQSTSAQKVMF